MQMDDLDVGKDTRRWHAGDRATPTALLGGADSMVYESAVLMPL